MKFARKPEKRDWINIAAILLLIGIFIWMGIEYTRMFGAFQTGDLISSAENFRQFVLSYGGAGTFVLLIFHVFQVIVAFIPAAVVQFAGGLIYGLPMGMLIGIIGTAAGTAVTFYISRLLGRRVVTLFVSEKSLDNLEVYLSGNTSAAILWLLFVIPFPKDFIAYFIGLTRMKAKKFFLISAVGRLPGMFVASYLGSSILERNYALLIGATALCCVSFLAMYFFKDKILKFVAQKR